MGSLLLAGLLGGCAAPRLRQGATGGETGAPAARPPREALPAGDVVVGLSVQGRPIEAITLGGSGRRILLIGGIHGDEGEGGRTINATIAFLRALEPDATIRLVRDANPDGAAAKTRTNARGVDLNRNWPARNYRSGGDRGPAPLSEPETRALHDEIERFDPELVLVCHSSGNGPFVNFDGPAGAQAAAFAAAAARTDSRWRVKPEMGYPTPGSLGSYLGVDRGVPILTIEFDRGHEPEAAWAAMRDGLTALLKTEPLAK